MSKVYIRIGSERVNKALEVWEKTETKKKGLSNFFVNLLNRAYFYTNGCQLFGISIQIWRGRIFVSAKRNSLIYLNLFGWLHKRVAKRQIQLASKNMSKLSLIEEEYSEGRISP